MRARARGGGGSFTSSFTSSQADFDVARDGVSERGVHQSVWAVHVTSSTICRTREKVRGGKQPNTLIWGGIWCTFQSTINPRPGITNQGKFFISECIERAIASLCPCTVILSMLFSGGNSMAFDISSGIKKCLEEAS